MPALRAGGGRVTLPHLLQPHLGCRPAPPGTCCSCCTRPVLTWVPPARHDAQLLPQVFYYLRELDEALDYALSAGSAFDINDKSEYVSTIIGAAPQRVHAAALHALAHVWAWSRSFHALRCTQREQQLTADTMQRARWTRTLRSGRRATARRVARRLRSTPASRQSSTACSTAAAPTSSGSRRWASASRHVASRRLRRSQSARTTSAPRSATYSQPPRSSCPATCARPRCASWYACSRAWATSARATGSACARRSWCLMTPTRSPPSSAASSSPATPSSSSSPSRSPLTSSTTTSTCAPVPSVCS